MAASKQISLYPQCTDSKECLYLVGPHTGKRYSRAPDLKEQGIVVSLWYFHPGGGATKAFSIPCKRLQLAL